MSQSERLRAELDQAIRLSRDLTLGYYLGHSVSEIEAFRDGAEAWFRERLQSGNVAFDDVPGSGVVVRLGARDFAASSRMLAETSARTYNRSHLGGLLEDRHRALLRERHNIQDNEEFLEFAKRSIEKLGRQVGKSFTWSELKEQLESKHSGHADALIECLEWNQALEGPESDPARNRRLTVAKRTDPSRFLTLLHGRSCGSSGLDQLLFGGYFVPARDSREMGIAMAISGPPGVGKSNLASAFAVAAAARGSTSYVLENERPTEILSRNIRAHYGILASYANVEELRRGEMVERRHQPRAGTVYLTGQFGGGAALSTSELATSFLEVASKKADGQEVLLVLDSASSYRQGVQDFEWRQELNYLCTLLTDAGISVLLVLEQNREEFREEDYVVDLAIHLTSTTDPSIAYAQRNLEIVKSRYQFSNRGLHFYSVRPGRGAVVYPSSAASITMRRRSEVHKPRTAGSSIRVDVDGFTESASRKNPPFLPVGSPVSWWHEGSLTLLTGPKGSYKQAFAQAFAAMQSSGEDSSGEDVVLSVHFGHELPEGSFSQNAAENEVIPSSVGQRYLVRRAGHLPVHHYLFRTSYFAPGPVMDELSRFLDDIQSRGRVRRAVVSDLAVLAAHFPFLQQDPLFIPTLCDLLTSFRVTTCLVYTPQEGPAPDRAYQLLTTFVENEIIFSGPGEGRYQLRVVSSSNNSHYAGSLDIEPAREAQERLQLTWSRALTSKEQRVPVQIFLDSGTRLQKQHNEMLREALSPALDVHALDLGMLYNRRSPLVVSGLDAGSLKLAAIDAFMVPWLAGLDGKLRTPLLEPLWATPRKLVELLDSLSYRGSHTAEEEGESLRERLLAGDACLHSVPYFLNPSLLVLDAAFYADHVKEPQIQSWAALVELLRGAKANHALGFSFRKETDETLNCLFFEILASLEGGFEAMYRFAAGLGTADEPADWPLVHQALATMRDLWELGGRSEDPGERLQCVAWREWYSTYRELESDIRTAKGGELRTLRILPLPGKLWTSGDWHLAVLRGSIFANVGLNIIEDHFVERGNAMNLMVEGVGLPPFQSFYEKQGGLPLSGVSPAWFAGYVRGEQVIYRSKLKNYVRYSKILSFHLRAMIESAPEKKNEEAHFRERVRQLFQIVRRSNIKKTPDSEV